VCVYRSKFAGLGIYRNCCYNQTRRYVIKTPNNSVSLFFGTGGEVLQYILCVNEELATYYPTYHIASEVRGYHSCVVDLHCTNNNYYCLRTTLRVPIWILRLFIVLFSRWCLYKTGVITKHKPSLSCQTYTNGRGVYLSYI